MLEIKTIEEYRNRMIEAFENANMNLLTFIACEPTEEAFKQMEQKLEEKKVRKI